MSPEELAAIEKYLANLRGGTVRFGKEAFDRNDPDEAHRHADRLRELNKADEALIALEEAIKNFERCPQRLSSTARGAHACRPPSFAAAPGRAPERAVVVSSRAATWHGHGSRTEPTRGHATCRWSRERNLESAGRAADCSGQAAWEGTHRSFGLACSALGKSMDHSGRGGDESKPPQEWRPRAEGPRDPSLHAGCGVQFRQRGGENDLGAKCQWAAGLAAGQWADLHKGA